MTARPCIDCGQPAPGTRCPPCAALRERPRDRRRGTPTERGYDASWRRLRARAIRAHPWCTDCGTRTDLTGDHVRWPARTLADVEVTCQSCNNRRGPARGPRARRSTR